MCIYGIVFHTVVLFFKNRTIYIEIGELCNDFTTIWIASLVPYFQWKLEMLLKHTQLRGL